MNKQRANLQILLATLLVALPVFLLSACSKDNHDHAQHALHEDHGSEDEHAGCDHGAVKHDEHAGCDHDADKLDEHAGCDHDAVKHDEHAGCNHDAEKHDENAGHDHETEKHDDKDDHSGHGHEGHGHASGEDLDKTVEELFAANCEHKIKTHECDECRYEVGVVKVPKDLIDRGLISVTNVSKRNFDSELGLTGEIQFDNQKIAHIGPRVPGVIRQVKVDIGDKLKAGRTLVVLESVELAEAQAAYLEELARQSLEEKTYKRQKTLRDKQFSSEMDYLEAQEQFETAKIRTNSAKQKLLRMGLSAGSVSYLAKTGLSAASGRLPVAAPFAGEVLELHAVQGERIEPGDEMVLLGDTSTLWVWIDIYELQLGTIKAAMTETGLPVSVSVRAWPDMQFSGRVDYIGNVMDVNTRTVKARVVLDNAHGKLRPGMFAKVAIGLETASGRLAAPRTSVISDEGRDFVFIRQEGDYFVRRPVKMGRQVKGYIELLDGVTEGQTIVATGAFLLKSDVLRSKMGEGCAH